MKAGRDATNDERPVRQPPSEIEQALESIAADHPDLYSSERFWLREAAAVLRGLPVAVSEIEPNIFERLNRRGIAMPIGIIDRLKVDGPALYNTDGEFLVALLGELLPAATGTQAPPSATQVMVPVVRTCADCGEDIYVRSEAK